MTQQDLEKFLSSFQGTWRDETMAEGIIAYKYGAEGADDSKLYALVENKSKPLRVSLRCDPLLTKDLREKFETIVPAKNLNRKEWNTVICTGQLPDEEILGLARLSYRIASGDI